LILALLGRYGAQIVSYRRFGTNVWLSLNVGNYQSRPRNIQEEQISHLHHDKILKSRSVANFHSLLRFLSSASYHHHHPSRIRPW